MWDPQRLTTLWACMAYYRDSFTYFTYYNIISVILNKENKKRNWEKCMKEISQLIVSKRHLSAVVLVMNQLQVSWRYSRSFLK
jgi:hypothetical protein